MKKLRYFDEKCQFKKGDNIYDVADDFKLVEPNSTLIEPPIGLLLPLTYHEETQTWTGTSKEDFSNENKSMPTPEQKAINLLGQQYASLFVDVETLKKAGNLA